MNSGLDHINSIILHVSPGTGTNHVTGKSFHSFSSAAPSADSTARGNQQHSQVFTAPACDTGWSVVTAPTGSSGNGCGKLPKALGAAINTAEHDETTLESTVEELDTEETMWVRVLVSVLVEIAVDVAWLLDTGYSCVLANTPSQWRE